MWQNVFNELFGQDDFMEPDEVTYAVLIKGYGQDIANPKWSKIRQILQGKFSFPSRIVKFLSLSFF